MWMSRISANDMLNDLNLEPGIADGAELQSRLGADPRQIDQALIGEGLFRHNIGSPIAPVMELLNAPTSNTERLERLSTLVAAINYIRLGNISPALAKQMHTASLISSAESAPVEAMIRFNAAFPPVPVSFKDAWQDDRFTKFLAVICAEEHVLSRGRLERAAEVTGKSHLGGILDHCPPGMPILAFKERALSRTGAQLDILYRWMLRRPNADTSGFGPVCTSLGLDPQTAATMLMEYVKQRHAGR